MKSSRRDAASPQASVLSLTTDHQLKETSMTSTVFSPAPARPHHQYRPEEGIRHSYADTQRRFVTPSGTSKPIRYGDRLFVRLVKEGRTLLNCMIDKVNDLTELYGEIRYITRDLRGLCTLHLRNASRGWSMERPLKLYGALSGPAAAPHRAPTPTAAPHGMEWPWWGNH